MQAVAQQQSYAGVAVSVVVHAGDDESIVANVVREAVTIYLGYRGFTVTVIESLDESGDAFAIIGSTSMDGDSVLISLELRELETNTIIGSVSQTAKVDLRLDVVAGDATSALIAEASERLAEVANAWAAGATEADATGAESQAGDSASSGDSSASDSTTGSTGSETNTSGAPGTGSDTVGVEGAYGTLLPELQPAVYSIAPVVFETSIGFAPLFSTGEASRYFDISYGGEFFADLVFTTPVGYIGVGLTGGAMFVRAEGLCLSADYIIVPFGLDLRFSSDPRPLGMFAGISGGGAVMTANTEAFGRLTKIVPYAAARTGAVLALGPGLGLALGITYSAYFEGSIVLMGFSPSVNVYLRL